MPPFRYDPYEDRYTGSIAEMMSRQSDPRARAAQLIAQAQARAAENIAAGSARAAEQSGQAWAGAAQGIGALPGQIQQAGINKQRQAALEQETAMRGLQLEQAQRANAGQRTMAAAMQTSVDPSTQPQGPDLSTPNGVVPQVPNFLRPDDNGVATWDVEGLSKYMSSQGYGDLNPTFVKDVNALNEIVRTEATARQKTIQHLADVSYRTGNDPTIARELLRTLRVNKFYPEDTLQQIEGTIGTPDFDRIVDGLRTPVKAEVMKPGEVAFDPVTRQPIPGMSVPEKTTPGQGDYTINGQRFKADGTPLGEQVTPLETPAQKEAASRAARSQDEIERHNKELERISSMTAGRTAASAAETERHNRAMEASARNRVTSRPMLSGDANRIVDIDTSIKEAAELQKLLANPGDTGLVSQIGKMLPNFVTEYTGGVGEEAKMRQAQIALVRQIIGKGLEGGVLRKEDELKYKDILPTIGDTHDVVKSKLSKLDATLKRKRETTLETLGDAGFNVDAMKTRGAPSATAAPPQAAPAPSAPATGLTPGLQGLANRKK